MKMARRSALLVACGGSSKDSHWPLLRSPKNDALQLAEVLKDPRIGGFDEAEVEVVVDEPEAEVRRRIARFFNNRHHDDLVLFYFSGHGHRDGRGLLHFVMRDTEQDLLSATSIPAAFLRSEVTGCNSRRRVLILDCCYSGAFSRDGLGAKSDDSDRIMIGVQLDVGGYGWFLMTASDALQKAFEGHVLDEQMGNSVFSHFIITGLRTGEADRDDDGMVTIDELYEYVYEQMSETALRERQTPSKFGDGQKGRMFIARNPNAGALRAETQPAAASPADAPPDANQTPPLSQLYEAPVWEQLYQKHFVGVWPATTLEDLAARALKAYNEIYWINCLRKNWPRGKFGLFDHDLAFYMAGWMKDNLRNSALEKLTQAELAKEITDYILRLRVGENDPVYSMMVERTYQRYFAHVTKDSTLPYIYQQAGKVYKDISQMNRNTKKWERKEYDHELLFYIAGWIKDNIVNDRVRTLSQAELAGKITDKIIAFVDSQSYLGSEAYLNRRAYANEWFTPPDDPRDEDGDD
jgi:hypothetical protein